MNNLEDFYNMFELNIEYETIIRKILRKYKLDNSLDDIELTYTEHIKNIRKQIKSVYKKYFHKNEKYNYSNIFVIKDDIKQFIENHYCIAFLKEMEGYYNTIINNIKRLDNIPKIEQRTPEWYAQRNEVISASSIYKVLSYGKKEILLEKIGIERPFLTNDAIVNGIVFEIVSQTLYETRNNITISEYGCIPHETHNFIGASPDGVVHDIKYIDMYNINYKELKEVHPNLTVNNISLFGRLLEIKNPTSRVITNKIKSEYQKQITTQQEVCKLYICDFLENKYNIYKTQDDFLNDSFCFSKVKNLTSVEINRYVKNHNIPLNNITEDGDEKGVIIQFSSNGSNYTSSLHDLTKIYNKENIDKWIQDEVNKYKELGFNESKVIYWSVKDYNLIVSGFNKTEWESLYNASNELWNKILEERLKSDQYIFENYNNLEIIDESKGLSTINNSSTVYKSRNLRKRKRVEKPIIKYSF